MKSHNLLLKPNLCLYFHYALFVTAYGAIFSAFHAEVGCCWFSLAVKTFMTTPKSSFA